MGGCGEDRADRACLFDHAIAECIRTPGTPDPAQRLVRAAVEQSGRDNTTAVVVEVL